MKKASLIKNHSMFEMVDYNFKNIDFKYYKPNYGLMWNWNELFEKIEENPSFPKLNNTNLVESSKLSDFDYKDVLIIQQFAINDIISSKQLGKILNLSETQIRKRIKKLQEKGIIKCFKQIFTPIPKDNLLYLYCFIGTTKYNKQVISFFYQLPFRFMFIYETNTKFCI